MTVLSAALVLTTIIYAWQTWKIADQSRRSAEASRDSAQAAKKAAEAAQTSAVVAQAQLPVDFYVHLDRRMAGEVSIAIEPNVNLWLHGARIDVSVMPSEDPLDARRCTAELEAPASGRYDYSLPAFLHANEGTSLTWPQPQFRPDDYALHGFILIDYSLGADTELRTRSVYFETMSGLGERLMKRFGLWEMTKPSDVPASESGRQDGGTVAERDPENNETDVT